MKHRRRIALALPLGVPHLAEVVHGIHLHARGQAGWELVTSPETHFIPLAGLRGWNGDGVLAMVNTPADRLLARRLSCPVVNLSGALPPGGVPRVRVDYRAAGRLAALHLLKRGLEHFAYYGLRQIFYAGELGAGFRELLAGQGIPCSMHLDVSTLGRAHPWRLDPRPLEAWLRRLALPVGIMVSHDPRAVILVQACRRLGLRVPEDVAVMGFNNDVQTCEFSDPPLTSIGRPGETIGREAAALLGRLMEGHRAPAADLVFPPGEVVERASTTTRAVPRGDALAAVLEFIDRRMDQPIGVADLVEHGGVSRRWLELAFRRRLRMTPHEYLSEVRVKRIRAVLAAGGRIRLKELARAGGFSGTRQMNQVFRRLTGMTVRQYASRPGHNQL